MRRLPAVSLICSLAAFATLGAGCGEGGVSSGATVSVYLAAPLCGEAQRELKQAGSSVEGLEVRAVCLPRAESDGRIDLAKLGANARRATEDSTAIAYLEGPNPDAAKYSQPIVESADIGWARASSGGTAIRRVLRALEGDTSSPRATVREALEEVG